MSSFFKALAANPLLKTVATLVVGSVATGIDAAFTHPSGGLADALAANPQYALIFGVAGYLFHNVVTAQTLAASSPQAPSAPDAAKK